MADLACEPASGGEVISCLGASGVAVNQLPRASIAVHQGLVIHAGCVDVGHRASAGLLASLDPGFLGEVRLPVAIALRHCPRLSVGANSTALFVLPVAPENGGTGRGCGRQRTTDSKTSTTFNLAMLVAERKDILPAVVTRGFGVDVAGRVQEMVQERKDSLHRTRLVGTSRAVVQPLGVVAALLRQRTDRNRHLPIASAGMVVRIRVPGKLAPVGRIGHLPLVRGTCILGGCRLTHWEAAVLVRRLRQSSIPSQTRLTGIWVPSVHVWTPVRPASAVR